MRPINKIIIQLIAAGSISALVDKHLAEGMPEVGFHYMIDSEGSTELGRSINNIGNHSIGENATSIGIACLGTSLTKKHESSIDTLLEELSTKGIDTDNVFFLENGELKKYK